MKLERIDSISDIETFTVNMDKIRVTDPCYDMETWCAGTIENVKGGTWDAHIGYHKDSSDMEMSAKWRQDHVDKMEQAKARGDDALAAMHAYDVAKYDKSAAEYIGRVAFLHIVHSDTSANFDHSTELDSTWQDSGIDVGVDSGQAGFFDEFLFDGLCHAPEMKEEFYRQVCDLTCGEKQWGTHLAGVVSSTGYGDGSYTCMVRRDDHGQAIEAVILYLTQYDEEEDDAEDTSEGITHD